jgi:protein SCO1
MKMHKILLLIIALFLAGCTNHTYKATVLDPAEPAFNIELTDQNGQPFSLAAQKGKVVLLFFGFTSCPDICPIELANLASAKRQLGATADDLQVALVSLDPERDTQERLATYVASFDPEFIGLRGEQRELDPVARAYGVFYERRELPDSALGYTIDHAGYIYGIDRAGNWRLLFAQGTPVEDLAADIGALLRER